METNGKEGKVMETAETTPENGDTIASDKETLTEEIRLAMEELEETDKAPETADDSQGAEVAAEAEAKPIDEAKVETSSSEIDDALVERAVKAGLSLSDARSFASGEVLERVVSSMESKAAPQGADGDGDDGSTVRDGHEDSALPPALTEDDGYDPGLVAAFNGLRDLVQKQNQRIAELSQENTAEKETAYFNSLVDTLDDSTRKGLDDKARGKLRDQFEVLVAGYQKYGVNKPLKDVFSEAAKIAIGDRLAGAEQSRRAEALSRRKNLAIAKPGGESGARKGGGQEDADAELAAMLEQKFGG